MGAMTGLLLLLWAGVTVGSVVDLQKRIINGTDCKQGDRKYHVTLIDNMGYLCGGSLISDEWILTAAHCCKNETGWKVKAFFGRHLNSPSVEIQGTPEFFSDIGLSSSYREHDIMLLRIPAQPGIATVPLPAHCPSPLKKGDVVQIAGRGAYTTYPNKTKKPVPLPHSKPLQCGDTNVVDCQGYTACLQKAFPNVFKAQADKYVLCYKSKVDGAGGDSGGGVVFKGRIYGVHVQSGPDACSLGVAMKVCEYMDWIVNVTGLPRP